MLPEGVPGHEKSLTLGRIGAITGQDGDMRRIVALIAGVLAAVVLVLMGTFAVQALGIQDSAGEPQPVEPIVAPHSTVPPTPVPAPTSPGEPEPVAPAPPTVVDDDDDDGDDSPDNDPPELEAPDDSTDDSPDDGADD